jgi:hypothetical protein
MAMRITLSIGLTGLALLATAGLSNAQSTDTTSPGPAGDVEPTRPSETAQVVVLHNESVIQGHVDKYRDRLIVSNGPWYVVRVPMADVDFVAPDLAAAFRIKQSRIGQRDFARHLRLAQWCLRHDLDRFAADQLQLLKQLDPLHPSITALQQQLSREAGDMPVLGEPAPIRPAAVAQSASPLTPDLPPVSRDSVAEFTRTIQPLLLNRCGQTTCHGSAAHNGFQLLRLKASGVARQDVTMRNLRAAMAQIDPANPQQSSLLDRAQRPHGKGGQFPFGPHESRQYQRLLDWVNQATGAETTQSGEPDASLATAERRVAPQRTVVRAADWYATETDASPTAEPVGVDPYDPAQFNARFDGDTAVQDDEP